MVGELLKGLDGPVFVTGDTGFKGSWLSLVLNELGIEHFGYSLQAEENSLYQRARLASVAEGMVGDIRDFKTLSSAIDKVKPSVIIHLAAQALVMNSYQEPLKTFETNCIGTANVLKSAFETPSVKVVLVITTDKVYRNENNKKKFVETDPLGGEDPYSASKVAAEAACAAWQKISDALGGPVVLVARAGNVIGGGDLSMNRLIPDIIRAKMAKHELCLRNPNSTRPWQHVLDPLFGYLRFIEYALRDSAPHNCLNFGPLEKSLSVSEVMEVVGDLIKLEGVKIMEQALQKFEHANLELDSTLALNILNWKPFWNQEQAIKRTFSWWQSVLDLGSDPIDTCREDIEFFISQNNNLRGVVT